MVSEPKNMPDEHCLWPVFYVRTEHRTQVCNDTRMAKCTLILYCQFTNFGDETKYVSAEQDEQFFLELSTFRLRKSKVFLGNRFQSLANLFGECFGGYVPR